MELPAPIAAVTVHPDRARVTRRGTATVPAGAVELVVTDLPEALAEDSVRVAVTPGVRVAGVDVVQRDRADVPDPRVRDAEAAVRAAERAVAAVEGADAADAAREELLRRLASRSGDRLAAALADGSAGPERVAEVGAAVAAQLVDVMAARRDHAERRADAEHALTAARAELDRLRGSGRRRREVRVALEVDAEGEVGVELTYLVPGAGWSAAYDARVEGERLTLTCYGLVTQASGEDWPACELTLSTARPSVAGSVPELDPWWVDVRAPIVTAMPMAAAAPAPEMARARFVAQDAAMNLVATPVDNPLAVAWRLPRPTAVPADGRAHRATVDVVTPDARLDHVTAPVLDPVVHLRATATAPRVLPPGPVTAFVDGVFVGSSALEQAAPGAELELALGMDERVAVERELADRTASRSLIGGRRESVETWTITVRNGRTAVAHLVVRDRVPVSRSTDVQVVDVAATPEAAERDDLGRVEWRADVAPGAEWTARLRFGLRHARDLTVSGWR